MHELTQWLLDSIRAHGSISVLIGVLIESVIVPIPSPLIIMGAGAVLVPAEIPGSAVFTRILFQIVLPGSIGSTLGAYVGYGIGFWGGQSAINRLQRFLGFGWSDVQTMERRLTQRHAGLIILVLRALPIIPLSLISIGAGIIRWPVGSFSFWTFLGSIPRCFILGFLGWMARDTYQGLAHRMDRVESLISAGILITGLFVILWLRRQVQKRSGK